MYQNVNIMKTKVINIRHEKYDVYIGKAGRGQGRIHALKGKTQGCLCKPYPCHGYIIAEYPETISD
jgi:hypothetical protein